MQLPQAFLTRLQTQLSPEGLSAYSAAMEEPPKRGLRANTLKTAPEEFARLCPWHIAPSDMVEEGFLLLEEAPGLGAHPLHRAGLFYSQEPSAMVPVAALDPKPNMRVLDLCAAPGGKSGQIAARMAGKGLLVSNELVPSRAQVLCRTLERLGAANALVTCMHPDALCKALAGWFDMVLVDAPCSGEGMFRKDPQAIAEWSPNHVLSCAARQENILDSAALALRSGGRLCYSTCTFSPQEDELAVERFLERQKGAFTLIKSEKLWPHACSGEGHFYALMEKTAGEEPPAPIRQAKSSAAKKRSPDPLAPYHTFVREEMAYPPSGTPTLLADGRVMLLPDGLPESWRSFRIVSCGVQAGEIKNGRFTPAHGLYLAYPASAFCNRISLEDEQLISYFRGNALPLSHSDKGWCAVTPKGLRWPVGFGKYSDGMLKNHLPKGLRE